MCLFLLRLAASVCREVMLFEPRRFTAEECLILSAPSGQTPEGADGGGVALVDMGKQGWPVVLGNEKWCLGTDMIWPQIGTPGMVGGGGGGYTGKQG